MITPTFRQNIAVMRARWRVTQGQFAELLGVTRFQVQNWENGRSNTLPAGMLRKLETLTGWDADTLMNEHIALDSLPRDPGGAHDARPLAESVVSIEAQLYAIQQTLDEILSRLPKQNEL